MGASRIAGDTGKRAVLALIGLLGAVLVSGCAGMPGVAGRDRVVIAYDGTAERTLLLQPLDGGRLSSTFGPRHHPLLGRKMMHRGVDYAAPAGTTVRAAGDGVIVRAGRRGAYGRYVRIRHDDTYETAYAHLADFAPGIAPGRRVRQGEPIGLVGSSGRSTGPHLHYEVLADGRQIDPFRAGPSFAGRLKGGALDAWRSARAGVGALGDRFGATARRAIGPITEPVAALVAGFQDDAPACDRAC